MRFGQFLIKIHWEKSAYEIIESLRENSQDKFIHTLSFSLLKIHNKEKGLSMEIYNGEY